MLSFPFSGRARSSRKEIFFFRLKEHPFILCTGFLRGVVIFLVSLRKPILFSGRRPVPFFLFRKRLLLFPLVYPPAAPASRPAFAMALRLSLPPRHLRGPLFLPLSQESQKVRHNPSAPLAAIGGAPIFFLFFFPSRQNVISRCSFLPFLRTFFAQTRVSLSLPQDKIQGAPFSPFPKYQGRMFELPPSFPPGQFPLHGPSPPNGKSPSFFPEKESFSMWCIIMLFSPSTARDLYIFPLLRFFSFLTHGG